MRTNISLLLFAALLSLAARAQGDATAYLKSLLDSGRVTAVYNFNVEGSTPLSGCGTAVLEGNCLRINGGGMQILCDGSAIYTVDTEKKEVYIEKADSEGSLLKDPKSLLNSIKDLKYGASSVSGSLPNAQDGSVLHFVLSDIRKAAPKNDPAEFRFDTASAGADWVITDLR